MPIKKTIIEKANRLYQLPPGLESIVARRREKGMISRRPVIDLMRLKWPGGSGYGTSEADWLNPAAKEQFLELREALAAWYLEHCGVKLHPVHEVFLGGSISSIMLQLALAFIERGDLAFVPQLGLPLYRKVVSAAGGEAIAYSVSRKDSFKPSFEKIGTRLGSVARVLFLNSPHNPTGYELSQREFDDLAMIAARANVLVVNDTAYRSLRGQPSASLLSVTGGKRTGLEVGSFAYNFGLPALPFGYAVGHRDAISGLRAARSLIYQRFPRAYVTLALAAVGGYPDEGFRRAGELVKKTSATAEAFQSALGLEDVGRPGTPFVWTRLPARGRTARAPQTLYRRGRILVGPGRIFGETGEGYFRLSLTAGAEAFEQAAKRVSGKKGLLSRKSTDA